MQKLKLNINLICLRRRRLAELFVNKKYSWLKYELVDDEKKYFPSFKYIFIKYYHIPNSVQRRAAALSCHTMFFFSFCICLSRIKYCYSSCLRSQLARTQKKNTRTISTWHDYAQHTHAKNLSHTARKKSFWCDYWHICIKKLSRTYARLSVNKCALREWEVIYWKVRVLVYIK